MAAPLAPSGKGYFDKRILILGDFHAGHRIGLCPPDWANHPDKFIDLRKQLWDFYTEQVDRHKPYYLVVVNGDLIDGKGERSGGTELITSDRLEQAEMAKRCIDVADCKLVRCTYGTPYHSGQNEDMEKVVIDKLEKDGYDAQISSMQFININGKEFNFRHFGSASQIEYMRYTPLAREVMQNRTWHRKGQQPLADFLCRHHVHYDAGPFPMDDCIAMTGPALQGLGSKFGSRKCSGPVSFGIAVTEVATNGDISWPKIIKVPGIVQAEISEVL